MNGRGSYGQSSASELNPPRISASRSSFQQNNERFSQIPLTHYDSIYLDEQNNKKQSISPNKQQTIVSRQPPRQIKHQQSVVDNKKRLLRRVKYINQLALMDYEEKHDEIYTKYSKVSKQTVLKKIKAKNQIAQFIDEEQNEEEGFDELIQFKYGKDKPQGYHFQAKQINEHSFCPLCDSIHNDHQEVHKQVCSRKRIQDPQLYSPYSQKYTAASLQRIYKVISQIKSVQYENLAALMIRYQQLRSKLINSQTVIQKVKLQMDELMSLHQQDPIFIEIAGKIKKLLKIP